MANLTFSKNTQVSLSWFKKEWRIRYNNIENICFIYIWLLCHTTEQRSRHYKLITFLKILKRDKNVWRFIYAKYCTKRRHHGGGEGWVVCRDIWNIYIYDYQLSQDLWMQAIVFCLHIRRSWEKIPLFRKRKNA